MKGLKKAIGMSVVHPTWRQTRPGLDEHTGWAFAAKNEAFSNPNGFGSNKVSDIESEPFYGAKFVRDLYEIAHDQHGKYSVPVFWDKKLKTIVSNESSEII